MSKNAVNSKVREIINDTMSLKALLYDAVNHHEKLTDALGELVKKVEIRRNDLAATMDW